MAAKRILVSSSYTLHNKVSLIRGGAEYFAVLESMISQAREIIHLQTYIFDDDVTGRKIIDALSHAVKRGVKVFLLVDAYASSDLSEKFATDLKSLGIHFRRFMPFFKNRNFYFGRRMHHKIVVCDAKYSLVSGLNISDKYNDLPGRPAWLDWAIYAEGQVSWELFKVCTITWYRSSRYSLQVMKQYTRAKWPDLNCAVRVRRNDWVRGHNQITKSYLEMFMNAQEEIIIMSSYFLPGRVMRRNMAKASARGVKCRLILANKSDVSIAKNAERFIYRWMLRNGFEIYEYPKRILHGKISTFDGRWVTAGSYNVNNISAFASVELNLDVDDRNFAESVRDTLNKIIPECELVTDEVYSVKYHFFERMIQALSYELIRLIFFIFTFYFKQKRS
ncbi:MAG: phospholipase D-like domain-containing protein [Chitinophagaceae bacterium]